MRSAAPGASRRLRVPSSTSGTGSAASRRDGKTYVTILGEGQWTPAPWINVVSNGTFGFQVSECGAGYTWAINSRENQLTPWSNDPVSDPPGEVFYVRDDDTGELWGPTALPIRDAALHLPRPPRTRPLALRAHVAWHRTRAAALRPGRRSRQDLAPHPRESLRAGAAPHGDGLRRMGARELAGRVRPVRRHRDRRGDRRPPRAQRLERGVRHARRVHGPVGPPDGVDGRSHRVPRPQRHARPSRRARATGHPVRARSVPASIRAAHSRPRSSCAPGERIEVTLLLGQAETADEARALVARHRTMDTAGALLAVERQWDDILSVVQVRTPDRSLDILLNSLAALSGAGVPRLGPQRVLPGERRLRLPRSAPGRHGAHRRRGATSPASTCCAPPRGSSSRATSSTGGTRRRAAAPERTSRTTCSGCRTRRRTTSTSPAISAILDEQVPFLEGQRLAPEEHDAYFTPAVSRTSRDVLRALRARAGPQPSRRLARPPAHGHR